MSISQPQNLRTPPLEKLKPYGIRVSLPPGIRSASSWGLSGSGCTGTQAPTSATRPSPR